MDRGAWWAAVHAVATSRTRLSDFTFTFHFYALEEEMATHSRILAWRIPGMGEPGGLPSVGSHRVGNDWSDLAAAAAGCFPGGTSSKEPTCQRGRRREVDSNLGSGRSLGVVLAAHSSIPAWRIPWTKELGEIQSIGSQKVGHDSSDLAAPACVSFGLNLFHGKIKLYN